MTASNDLPLLVLGAGGHARVLIDALQARGTVIEGILDPARRPGEEILGVPVLGDDDTVERYGPAGVVLVNGVGSLPEAGARRIQLYETMRAKGHEFATVVHPSAVVSAHARLEPGAQVMAGAVVQAGVRIGANTIVNTGTCVDHDCVIGSHVHLAPGTSLSGGVRIEERVHVGTGAAIIHDVTLGASCVIGAGATVVRDVAAGERYLEFGRPRNA